jgi:4-amino-4-deoxy-L-arabinose transferase-like glycosyltransferase
MTVQHRSTIVFILSVLASVAFSFLVFPMLRFPLNLNPDPEGIGRLAGNICGGAGYVWESDEGRVPAFDRGPVYPYVVAGIRCLLGDRFLSGVQVFQALCLGLTGLVVYHTTSRLAGSKIALGVQVLTSFNPVLVWYSSRIWVETLHGLLISLLALSLVLLDERPSTRRSLIAGILIGVCALTKSVLLLFPVILFVYLAARVRSRGWLYAGVLTTAVISVVSPWTVRNYVVSGEFVAVHTTLGLNLFIGDKVAEDVLNPPASSIKYYIQGRMVADSILDGTSKNAEQPEGDRILVHSYIGRAVASPVLFLKRVVVNLLTFWYLGESPLKSMILGVFTFPLAVISLVCVRRNWSRDRRTRALMLLAAYYWLVHGLILGFGRFSAALIPILLLLSSVGTTSFQELLPWSSSACRRRV